MTVTVQLFAGLKDLVGRGFVEIELPDSATVGQLRIHLEGDLPEAALLLSRSLVAVDEHYAENHQILESTSRIALIPPVSGG